MYKNKYKRGRNTLFCSNNSIASSNILDLGILASLESCISFLFNHLGLFNTKEEAIKARKEAELKYFGKYRYQG